jgi:hypothetical protein
MSISITETFRLKISYWQSYENCWDVCCKISIAFETSFFYNKLFQVGEKLFLQPPHTTYEKVRMIMMDPLFAWRASSTARWTIFIIIWIRLMYVRSNKNRNEKSGKKVLSCERQGEGSWRKNEFIRMMKSTIPSSVFQTVLMFFMFCFLLRVKPTLYCLCIRKRSNRTTVQYELKTAFLLILPLLHTVFLLMIVLYNKKTKCTNFRANILVPLLGTEWSSNES